MGGGERRQSAQCLRCGITRTLRVSVFRKPRFTGLCRRCWGATSVSGTHSRESRWKVSQSLIKYTVINCIGKFTRDLKGIGAMHGSLARWYGKPNHCENDPFHIAKNNRYERAILNGIYTRNPEDYASLCPTCHKGYDAGKIRIRGLFKSERMKLNELTG